MKRPSTTNSTDQEERPTKCQRLAVDIEKSTIESLQIKDSPPIGAEETVFATSLPGPSHQEMINKLTSMKSQSMHSIQTNVPLSDLHRQLNLRRDMKFIDLFNWRTDHYPSTYPVNSNDSQLETAYEMSNLLAQWYLDRFEVTIPEHQYTYEDFQFSSHWARGRVWKILLPVVQQLLFTSHTLPKSDCIMLPTPASTDLEDLCVIWGGQFEGIGLVNTCPVDNFITLLSLHSYQISEALRLSDVSQTNSLQTMLSHIEHREFDELRIWPQLGVQNVNMRYDFLGYEGAVVQLLTKLSLNFDCYKVIFQCWSCCCQSERNLT